MQGDYRAGILAFYTAFSSVVFLFFALAFIWSEQENKLQLQVYLCEHAATVRQFSVPMRETLEPLEAWSHILSYFSMKYSWLNETQSKSRFKTNTPWACLIHEGAVGVVRTRLVDSGLAT